MLDRFVDESLHRTASPIDDRLVVAVLAAVLPVVLSIVAGMAYGTVTGRPEPGPVETNVLYGASALAVVALVYATGSSTERDAIFRFERPSRNELLWVLAFVPLGVVVFLAGSTLANALGFSLGGYEYSLSDPIAVLAVTFGAVLVAPLAEEILFRGFLLGSLLGRGVAPLLAGALALVAFGLIHLPVLGAAGVVATGLWAMFPTLLRLRFDNLTGAWLLHFLNNVWSYLVVVGLGFA